MSNQPEVDAKTAASIIDNDSSSSSDSSSDSDNEDVSAAPAEASVKKVQFAENEQDSKAKKGRALRTEVARTEDQQRLSERAAGPRNRGAARLAHRHRNRNRPLLKTLSRGMNSLLLRAGITRRSAKVVDMIRVIGLAVCAELMQGANVLTAYAGRKQVQSRDVAAACRYKLSEDMHVIE